MKTIQKLTDKQIQQLRAEGRLLTPEEAAEYKQLLLKQAEIEHFSILHFNQQAEALANHLAKFSRLLTEQEAKEFEEYKRMKAAGQEEWLTGKEAAEFLGCSSSTITKLMSRGKLEFTLEGNRAKYSRSGLIRFRERNRFQPIVAEQLFG